MRHLICMVMLVALSPMARAGIVISFNYNDPTGQGFNDITLGPTRRTALQAAANNFATAFSSYTGSIVMDVDGTATGSTLASAGDRGGPTFSPGFGNNEVIRNKLLNGADINGGTSDGTVNVNFASVDWQLDINTTPTGGAFDWYSTMYHEFAHAFGFSSGIQTNSAGTGASDPFGTTGANNGDFAAFDEFLADTAGNSVFDSGSDLNETEYESLLTGGASPTNGLFFNGANAMAANDGNPVGLFSPTTFAEGSSGSHLDDENAALANSMMLAATGAGPSARLFSDIELGIFRDIGYTNIQQISAVPEPGCGVLLLIASVGMLRRRERPMSL